MAARNDVGFGVGDDVENIVVAVGCECGGEDDGANVDNHVFAFLFEKHLVIN